MKTNMEEERFRFSTTDGTLNDKWLMFDLPREKTNLPMVSLALTKNCVSDDNGPRIRIAIHDGDIVDTSSELTSFFFGHSYVKGPFDVIMTRTRFELIESFIKLNRQVLMDFWNCNINGAQLLDDIVPYSHRLYSSWL